jgi:hypothetical protein
MNNAFSVMTCPEEITWTNCLDMPYAVAVSPVHAEQPGRSTGASGLELSARCNA